KIKSRPTIYEISDEFLNSIIK
ncbi:TPA: hypothetical protein ACOGCC_001190, partial [Staphylococcus aureus]